MIHSGVQHKYDEALVGLKQNTWLIDGFDQPVLTEGGLYPGTWLECGPMEGLVYGRWHPEIAKANHDIYFALQQEDGYLPCWIKKNRSGSAQIQMVVPIAATAWETFQLTGDRDFLGRAYLACIRWDHWLKEHRNTRKTGLCELFCEFDTGHDNSPRLAGVPQECPQNDARLCPRAGRLPYLAPDLSSTVYGGRVALAKMAEFLQRPEEAQTWRDEAENLRKRIIDYCYDSVDECFYDVDANGEFVRVRGDALIRVLGEHVVDQTMFERIYERHLHNPASFWTPFPFPSIAADDPAFVAALPDNSWGGASQALTALRAPRWMTHYGKSDDLIILMKQWVRAILKSSAFMQQANPWTGEFTTSPGYTASMLVFISFVDALKESDTLNLS